MSMTRHRITVDPDFADTLVMHRPSGAPVLVRSRLYLHDDSAVLEMGDDLLKKITRELVESVRRNAAIDWSEKEQVRARMRAAIRRLLIRYGYPPDKQSDAIDLVMHQAELLAQAA